MVCRHTPGDPDCGRASREAAQLDAYDRGRREALADARKRETSLTPDAANYEIEEVEVVGHHLVMRVKYPNCSSCAFEGSKVMVFLHVQVKDALKWRRIDPHFRDPKGGSVNEAPSPAARFPGSKDGWTDALCYARGKS